MCCCSVDVCGGCLKPVVGPGINKDFVVIAADVGNAAAATAADVVDVVVAAVFGIVSIYSEGGAVVRIVEACVTICCSDACVCVRCLVCCI